MTARAARVPAGRHDRLTERHGRLAHGRELDRVAAGALDRARRRRSTSTARGSPGSRWRRPRGRRCRRSRVRSVPTYPLHARERPQTPTAPDAAWYTRGSRPAIEVTTSQVFVVRCRARSSTRDPLVALGAEQRRTRRRVTGGPGTSVTSTMTASIATLPTSGAARRGRGPRRGSSSARGVAVAVAERQGRDAARPGGRERRPVADAVAGRQVRDPHRAGVERHHRPEGVATADRRQRPIAELVGDDPVDRQARVGRRRRRRRR